MFTTVKKSFIINKYKKIWMMRGWLNNSFISNLAPMLSIVASKGFRSNYKNSLLLFTISIDIARVKNIIEVYSLLQEKFPSLRYELY